MRHISTPLSTTLSNHRNIYANLLFAYAIFFGGMGICVLLRPESLSASSGFSYFGVYSNTLPVYTVTYCATAIFTIRAGMLIPPNTSSLRYTRALFVAIGVLTLILLATPYTGGAFSNWAHTIAGCLLFGMQFLFIVITSITTRNSWLRGIAVVMLIAGGSAGLDVMHGNGALLQMQLLFQLGFLLSVYLLSRQRS